MSSYFIKQISGDGENFNKFLNIFHEYEKLHTMVEDESSKEEKRLQDALEFSDAIIATVREPLLVLDNKLRIITANRSFYRIFQVNPEETEKRLIYDLGNRQWNIPGLKVLLENILPMNNSFEDFEVEHYFKSIGQKTMLLNARKIYREMNHTEMILLAIEDITERKKAEEQLKLIASMDGLTGIANRRHFDTTLDLEWRRAMRSATSLSLIIADVDYFKNYNDLYGHLAGDSCLQKIAHAIRDSLRRAGNFAARYGGEEFIIILPETDSEGAYVFAESLREKIENMNIEHKDSKAGTSITLSMGVATTIPEKNSTQDELIALADKSLYKAKQDGRNRVVRGYEES